MAALSRCITCVEGLTLLITSRAPLHLSGEVEYALGPLKDTDAVELFLTRARAVRQDLDPDQSTATVICRRLDGLPLALELAAARTKSFLMLETLREYAAERLTVASRAMPVAPTAPADRSTPSAPSDAT